MGVSRFVRPETATLTISNGDTLTVKKRLTAGEVRAKLAREYIAGADGKFHADPFQFGVAIITAYLLDWSLTDEDGTPVPIKGIPLDDLTSIIDNLDPDSFGEIVAAISAHEEALGKAKADAKKKTRSGATASSAISVSPVVAAGGMSGSPN